MPYTSHGHWYGEAPAFKDMYKAPTSVARCGGPGLCVQCSQEASITPGQLEILKPEPGDVLVFTAPVGVFTYDDIQPIVKRMKELFPKHEIIFLMDGAKLEACKNSIDTDMALHGAVPDHGDPKVGDPVTMKGTLLRIEEGFALVEVYRSEPIPARVWMQCGALEYNEKRGDPGTEVKG